MAETKDTTIAQTEALLTLYNFDLGEYTAKEIVSQWLELYQPIWLRLAVLEALYFGRYKAISVENILIFWLKREAPIFHFSVDFENIICSKILESTVEDDSDDSLEENFDIDNFSEFISVSLSQETVETIEDKPIEILEKEKSNDKKSKPLISSIHKFIPQVDISAFYFKLKAFANQR